MSSDQNPDAREFFADSRFQKLARRAGGVSRDAAIQRAQATIDGSKPGFQDWLDVELNELRALTQKAAAGGFSDLSWLEAADEHCRHIRDVGTTMGYQLLTFVANSLSDVLEAVAAGAEYRNDLVDCHVEALLLAKQEQYRNMRPEQLPELSSGLRRVAERAALYGDGQGK